MTAEDAILDADLYSDEDLEEADIVEWYEARPMTVSTYVATGAVIGAFALGVLIAGGVTDDRIRVEGRGAIEPAASNEDPAGRRANRRMEIAIFAGEARREAALARN